MNELDNLRPEVREAVEKMDTADITLAEDDQWQIARAELLRLADENAQLHESAQGGYEDGWHALRNERDALHETIKRMNRRVQVAEAGVAEKVKESGGSLGRALANAAADMFMHERDDARAELAALKARIAGAPRADGQRVFDLLCLPVEYDGTLALVPVED